MLDVVIVLFNPNETTIVSNLEKIQNCPIVNNIIYVDNSSVSLGVFSEIEGKVKYFPLNENLGIAKAQNFGLDISLDNFDSDAVILFDQDSILDSDLLECLYKDYCDLKGIVGEKLAAIGPNIIDSFSGKSESNIDLKNLGGFDSKFEVKREIIASGKLINKSILLDVGLMEEELFIDGVDHEWCWRANDKGFFVYVSKQCSMVHTVGDSRKKIGPVTLRVSSPIRLYYQFRNYFILFPRRYVPLYWKIRNLCGYIFKFLLFGFFVNDCKDRRKYMVSGILDGLRRRKGRYGSL